MADPISALEHYPTDLVHEVNPEAIDFYVDELSGLYLPDDFVAENGKAYDVSSWKLADRLNGKFGRFEIRSFEDDGSGKPIADLLVMGTTIGLRGLDSYRSMHSLRHYDFDMKINQLARPHVEKHGAGLGYIAVDYGYTDIVIGDGGTTSALRVSGKSMDYGRAKKKGRQQTCDMFSEALGEDVQVVNVDPKPYDHDKIVKPWRV